VLADVALARVQRELDGRQPFDDQLIFVRTREAQ
jgi:hypothetical protein